MIQDLPASNNPPALSTHASHGHLCPRGGDSSRAHMPIDLLSQNSYMCEFLAEVSAPAGAHSNPKALVSYPRNIGLWGVCIPGNGLSYKLISYAHLGLQQ